MRSGVFSICVIGVTAVAACTDETALTGEERDLLSQYTLPSAPPADPSNMVGDDSKAAILGKKLFFDPRFSGPLGPANKFGVNGSLGDEGAVGLVSCASCHDPASGGSDHRSKPAATSLGAGYTGRNAPTIFNVALSDVADGGWQFWDGRKDSLWGQALGPSESRVEHNGSRLGFAHVIAAHYKADYEAVFGTGSMPDVSALPNDGKPGDPNYDTMLSADQKLAVDTVFANFGKAIAAYERRLVSMRFSPSPFDQLLAGDDSAMSASAIRGAKLFVGKAACDECHRGPAFSDFKFHNIGCPQEGDNALVVDVGRSNGVLEVKGDEFNRASAFSDRRDDSHLANLPELAADVGAFKTALLRNAAKTAPYMHDGVYENLWDVVNHYNFGGATGVFSGTKEVTLQPLLLDDRELGDLVEFLTALSDGDPLPDADFPEGLVAPPTFPP